MNNELKTFKNKRQKQNKKLLCKIKKHLKESVKQQELIVQKFTIFKKVNYTSKESLFFFSLIINKSINCV